MSRRAMSMQRILVLGATGNLGPSVCEELFRLGYHVRVLSRNNANAIEKLKNDQYEYYEGSYTDIKKVSSAMKECFTVHISIQHEEELGVQNILEIAKTSKTLRKIIYVSGASVTPERDFQPMIKTKVLNEKRIIEFCEENPRVKYTILRPTWIMEMIPFYIRKQNTAIIIGKQPLKQHFICCRDYAKSVGRATMESYTHNKIYKVYGPEKLTLNEAFIIFKSIVCPEVKVVNYSIFLMKIMGYFVTTEGFKEALSMMEYFEYHGEWDKDKNVTNLGANNTTFKEWCKKNKKKIREKLIADKLIVIETEETLEKERKFKNWVIYPTLSIAAIGVSLGLYFGIKQLKKKVSQ